MFLSLERVFAKRHLVGRGEVFKALAPPNPDIAVGTDTMPQIRHIVIVMMENHSYDNYFGMLKDRGDGLPLDANGQPTAVNKRKDGSTVALQHFPTTVQHSGCPSQTWHASHIQWDDGTNDGFVRSMEETEPDRDPTSPMGYWTDEDLPFYAGLARTFPLADRWFCSCLGPTFPNRRFLMAGTANGLIDDIPLGMFDYPATGTIFDVLARHRISWINYHHVAKSRVVAKRLLGAPGLKLLRRASLLLSKAFPVLQRAAQGNIQFTADLYPVGILRCISHLRGIDQFWRDAADGTLPDVCIVDPDFQTCSEENPQDIHQGEGFAARVINAVMAGKGWPDTLLIWLYDEHGGYYDHVDPPEAPVPDDVPPMSLMQSTGVVKWLLQRLGVFKRIQTIDEGSTAYDRYGFRVPAVVVSPYAKPDFVSHQVYDHTSVLKLIERKWNLLPLTHRDAAAVDPLEMLDFDNPPAFLTPPSLPEPAVPWSG